MELFAIFISFVVVVVTLWLLYCNEITYKQKAKMLNDNMDQYREDKDLAAAYKKMFRITSVPYNTHMFHLMTFRDPMKLYDLQEVD
jgi:hypothetical protein